MQHFRYSFIIAFSLGWLFPSYSKAQELKLFSAETFISLIKANHPVAKQAGISVDKANAEILSAKGGFDPVLDVDASRKTFDGKNYYNYFNPELKVATPLPLDIKTGLEDNGGSYLSSETSKGKTSYLGVELALGKGFLIDKRRAALKQARLFKSQTEQDRKLTINNLLFDAYTDYWQWAGAYQQYAVYNKFLAIAANRLRLIRIGFNNGERSLMDTIEAYTQVQNYQLMQAEAKVKWLNATLQVSNYLWLNDDSAYVLPNHFVPDTVQFALQQPVGSADAIVGQSAVSNPILKSYQFKLSSLEVEKKLKFQSLLPYFTVKGNLLSKNYYQPKGFDGNYLEKNYKWGVDFKLPLFLREGSGDYKKAQLKIKETNLELENKRWQLENKIRSYHNENTAFDQQLTTVNNMYNNYYALLKNEEMKFAQGESSLFLVNSRETKLLELVQKQIELRVKYQKSRYAIDWAAGMLQ